MIQNYRDLIVWQKSMKLVESIYRILKNFPNNEVHCLSSQLRRSAISIPSNIAEGFGRKSKAEFNRFLYISRGSLYELQTQTEIAKRLNYVKNTEITDLEKLMFEIEKMLNSLISKL